MRIGFSRGQIVLCSIALVLVSAIVLADTLPVALSIQEHPEIPQVRSTVSKAKPFTPPTPLDFEVVDERPIFIQGRKMPTEKPASVPNAPVAVVSLPTLVGIIIDPHDRIAVLRAPAAPQARNVRVGDVINDWLVAEIRADRVTLRSATATEELHLKSQADGLSPGGAIMNTPSR